MVHQVKNLKILRILVSTSVAFRDFNALPRFLRKKWTLKKINGGHAEGMKAGKNCYLVGTTGTPLEVFLVPLPRPPKPLGSRARPDSGHRPPSPLYHPKSFLNSRKSTSVAELTAWQFDENQPKWKWWNAYVNVFHVKRSSSERHLNWFLYLGVFGSWKTCPKFWSTNVR